MSTKVEAALRTHAKLGFSHLETAEIVENLDRLLANYHIHYQKLRNFHWNVVGADFFELHEKFEGIYKNVNENIDEVAERIRVFGTFPTSTLNEYLEISEIKEIPEELTSFEMVKEVLNDFEILLTLIMNVTEAANRIGDSGTVEMITRYIQELEKNHWMLTSWLKYQHELEPAV